MKTHRFDAPFLSPALSLPRRIVVVFFGFALTAISIQAPCVAQDLLEWNNPNGSFYDIGSNWNPVGPPTSFDAAQFLLDATYNVQWDNLTASTTPDVGFVDVGTGNVTFANQDLAQQHSFTINDDLTLFNGGQLTNSGLNLNVTGDTFLFQDSTLLIDGSHPAGSQFNSTGTIRAFDGILTFDNGAKGSLAGVELNVDSAGTASMNVLNGSQVTSGSIAIGNGASQAASSGGTLSVQGAASSLMLSDGSTLDIGNLDGLGRHVVSLSEGATLDVISSGSTVTNTSVNKSGALIVSSGAEFGTQGAMGVNGAMLVETGGVVNSGQAVITFGFFDSPGEVFITGIGSQWNSSGSLVVGDFRDGALSVEDGGVVTSASGEIAKNGGSTSVVNVTGPGSRWDNSSSLVVGRRGDGTLNIQASGVVSSTNGFIGRALAGRGMVTVSGAGSSWDMSGDLHVGDFQLAEGILNIEDGGVVTNTTGRIGVFDFLNESLGSVSVSGAGSRWNNSSGLIVGQGGVGSLEISSDGVVTNTSATLGFAAGSSGMVTVTDGGSQWNNSANLSVGGQGDGSLTVSGGGVVSNQIGNVGSFADSNSVVTVRDSGSRWNNTAQLTVGREGAGALIVLDGGAVSSDGGVIADFAGSSGSVNIGGLGSAWNNTGDLSVGVEGQGTLTISSGGLVSVGENTTINSQSAVNLIGGRFEFGTTTHDDLTRINATGGSMAGTINISGINDLAAFPALQNSQVDLTDVNLNNSGLLVGSQIIRSSLNNQASSELLTTAGQQAIFAGSLNNAGEVNNTGGVVRFEKSVNNQAGAFVGGRGVFGAGQGWSNEGVMAFNGTTDILGDVNNLADGTIVTSGGATTGFFDDVEHNGSEIRTSAGSNSVFFGEVTGAGDFTGTGTVFFEGDLRPGNSPDIVAFEGNVVMGTGANSYFELAGLDSGLFDQLLIDGDLALDGTLAVELLDGFQLTDGDEFVIADVGGDLSGQFFGLDEGDLVGRFGSTDLFISYTAGNGNDVGLFASAVPEPGTLGMLGLACLGLAVRRRRG